MSHLYSKSVLVKYSHTRQPLCGGQLHDDSVTEIHTLINRHCKEETMCTYSVLLCGVCFHWPNRLSAFSTQFVTFTSQLTSTMSWRRRLQKCHDSSVKLRCQFRVRCVIDFIQACHSGLSSRLFRLQPHICGWSKEAKKIIFHYLSRRLSVVMLLHYLSSIQANEIIANKNWYLKILAAKTFWAQSRASWAWEHPFRVNLLLQNSFSFHACWSSLLP